MVLDGLDGRIARMTHTTSDFGAQYDSLSDMVSFGAAPALVMYEWALKDLGKLGWIAAFVYCAGAALRLARFNTNIDVVDKRYFQGLPSPMAAAMLAAFGIACWWLLADRRLPIAAQVAVAVLLIYAVPFWVVAVFAAGLAVVSLKPSVVLFLMVFAYGVSGYILWAMGRRSRPAV